MGEREVTRVAILDRDATLIDVVRDEETGALTVAFHPDHIRFLPGAVEGLRALQRAGFAVAIATNQPGPAKGQFSAEAVRRTNDALLDRLRNAGIHVAALEVCMHHPEGGAGGDPTLVRSCDCRKPKPAMLHAVVQRLGADREESWMIGDGVGDIRAGRAAGLKTGLVFAPDRCELCPLRHGPSSLTPDVAGATIAEIAAAILAHDSPPRVI